MKGDRAGTLFGVRARILGFLGSNDLIEIIEMKLKRSR